MLSTCSDFSRSLCWLEEICENAGVKMMFFPKFHCELNYIEMIWAYAKIYLRRRCVFKFAGFEELLPNVLMSIPISYFKRVARHCFRFMDGYRKGLTGSLLKYAVKKYRGHRMIPAAESVALITEQYQKSITK